MEPRASSIALDAYADGSVYIRTEVGWPAPVHATSTLDALASDAAQLQACARRIASDLLADLGQVETTLLKREGRILSGRLDPAARQNLELWMREAGLPVEK
jgi:hypothetical protein